MIGALARKLFGSANERRIKGYLPRVEKINALEAELEKLSDEALRARTEDLKRQVAEGWCRPSPPCARPPSAPSASAISTCS
jgi:preprotein translocase subunit SecA